MYTELKRTWAEINLDNLEYNYHLLRRRIGDKCKFLGVVKGDAYGHGAVMIANELESLGADYLAVSSMDEARELRYHGISMPILVLGHTPINQVRHLIAGNITQGVSNEAKAKEYEAEAARLNAKLKVHIILDTGMSRLGFLCAGRHFEHGIEAVTRSVHLPHLDVEGVFTHFAVSDSTAEEDKEYTKEQFELFKKVIAGVEASGFKFRIKHCANTGAVAYYPETWMDMVRPGLLLYGYGLEAKMLGLKPVMQLKTNISTIKVYDEGTSVSYGATWKADKRTTMGVVPIGYADGLFRCLSNRYSFLVNGNKAPIRGRICMDMCMIDLTNCPGADIGDEVVIFGDGLPLDDMAEIAGTIPYEIICSISRRVPREFYRDGKLIKKDLKM